MRDLINLCESVSSLETKTTHRDIAHLLINLPYGRRMLVFGDALTGKADGSLDTVVRVARSEFDFHLKRLIEYARKFYGDFKPYVIVKEDDGSQTVYQTNATATGWTESVSPSLVRDFRASIPLLDFVLRPQGKSDIFPIAATPENVALAREFALRKWKERAVQMRHPEPRDLSSACKFTSMFAQQVFGGVLRGNFKHQFVKLHDGTIVDLNIDSEDVARMANAHKHDPKFFGIPVHRESMDSCKPRVEAWVKEFEAEFAS